VKPYLAELNITCNFNTCSHSTKSVNVAISNRTEYGGHVYFTDKLNVFDQDEKPE